MLLFNTHFFKAALIASTSLHIKMALVFAESLSGLIYHTANFPQAHISLRPLPKFLLGLTSLIFLHHGMLAKFLVFTQKNDLQELHEELITKSQGAFNVFSRKFCRTLKQLYIVLIRELAFSTNTLQKGIPLNMQQLL